MQLVSGQVSGNALDSSTLSRGTALRRLVEGLHEREGRLLAVLGLVGTANITMLTRLAAVTGLRASAARQFSKDGLREVFDGLVSKKLVSRRDNHYYCTPGVGFAALKAVHRTGALELLAGAVQAEVHPDRHYYLGPSPATELFGLRVRLAQNDARAGEIARRLSEQLPALKLVIDALLPALSPLDEEWLLELSPANLEALLELSLPSVEALAIPIPDAARFLDTHLELIPQLGSDCWAALGALALLRGDREAAERVAACPLAGDAARGIKGSLALVEGRLDEAIAVFGAAGNKAPALTGLARLLHGYALLARGNAADLEAAARVVNQRGRGRMDPMKQALSYQKGLVEYMRRPSELPKYVFHAAPATDAYSGLVRAHFALWFDVPEFEATFALHEAHALAEACNSTGNVWLRDQYRGVAHALLERGAGGEQPPEAPPPPPMKLKLWELRGRKPPWETALEGLEQLSRKSAGNLEERVEESERIVWRVRQFGKHFQLEPLLQKFSRGAFTRGRALALKHLTGSEGGRLLSRLPEEDRRVGKHVRVSRDSRYGYPQVDYFFAPTAFRELVGHPRVFLEDSGEPIEVALGTPHVAARTKGKNELELTIDPPDLSEALEVRVEANRLVVYELSEHVLALVKLVGSGLALPESARQRAMDALGGLAHLVAVQSSVGGVGRPVPADPTPWLRLVPRGMAIAITARTRPLGKNGPEVVPGRGAPTLVGRIDGEMLEATRDLARERALAAQAFEACGVSADTDEDEASPVRWQGVTAEHPEAALELLARLRELGDNVRVEWPEGVPLKLRPKVGRRQLRGTLASGVDFFLASGSLDLGEDLHVDLEELLALVAVRPGRYVELKTGEYVELEQDLRDLLDSIAAARLEERPGKRRGIALSKTALPVLERLLEEGQGFDPDDGAREYQKRLLEVVDKRYRIPRTLQAELRPYQVEGFQWLSRLAELGLGACLADDMGLGKTVQLIALLLQRRTAGAALIVAPTSVCENWRRELARFAPSLEVRSYVGPARAGLLDGLTKGSVVVTSYAILQQDAEALAALEFATVVLDEAQLVKNAESQRARAAFALRGRFRVVATGTPVENHVGDLHSLFRFALPGLLGSYASFNRRFGRNLVGEAGAPARRALRRLVQPFILRRTKAEVLEDLPALTEIQRSIELGPAEARLYESLRRTALARLAESTDDPRSRVQVLAEITRLRRLCCHPALAVDQPGMESSKIAAFLELVTELSEGRHRALVFSQFVDLLALVRAALDAKGITYQYLDGSTKPKDRTAAVDAFQAGEGELFLISLRAGGFGLNLTAADYVIHLDPWWNPAVESQASDRAHRIGQTRPVTVYRLVAAGTIEERIMELHRKKRDLADSVLDDTGRSATLSVAELRGLLDGA